jgi:hypothetical protein
MTTFVTEYEDKENDNNIRNCIPPTCYSYAPTQKYVINSECTSQTQFKSTCHLTNQLFHILTLCLPKNEQPKILISIMNIKLIHTRAHTRAHTHTHTHAYLLATVHHPLLYGHSKYNSHDWHQDIILRICTRIEKMYIFWNYGC